MTPATPARAFVGLEVILNSFSPVVNLGAFSCPIYFVSGITNLPSTLPAPVVIKGLPAIIVVSEVYVLESGVINALTSTPSKKTYNLVLGKKPVPLKLICPSGVSFEGLIKGIVV